MSNIKKTSLPNDVVKIEITLRRANSEDFTHPSGEPLWGNPYFKKTRFGWAVDTLRSSDSARRHFKALYSAGKVYVTDDEIIVVPRYKRDGK